MTQLSNENALMVSTKQCNIRVSLLLKRRLFFSFLIFFLFYFLFCCFISVGEKEEEEVALLVWLQPAFSESNLVLLVMIELSAGIAVKLRPCPVKFCIVAQVLFDVLIIWISWVISIALIEFKCFYLVTIKATSSNSDDYSTAAGALTASS